MIGKVSVMEDRKGLGYGILDQTFQGPKTAGAEFPYYQKDNKDLDDVEVDDDAKASVNKKVHKFLRNDPGAEKSANRLYFAGATTKLHACFENPEFVLEEIKAIARGTNLFAETSLGGYSSSKAFDGRSYRRTGTKKGWSEAPPLSIPAAEETEPDEDLYNLQDFANIQSQSLNDYLSFNDHT
jgi:hypothetical protein